MLGPKTSENCVRDSAAELTTGRFVAGTRFSSRIVGEWNAWQQLADDELRARLTTIRERRRQLLSTQTDTEAQIATYERRGAVVPPELLRKLQDFDRERNLLDRQLAVGEFEQRFATTKSSPGERLPSPSPATSAGFACSAI